MRLALLGRYGRLGLAGAVVLSLAVGCLKRRGSDVLNADDDACSKKKLTGQILGSIVGSVLGFAPKVGGLASGVARAQLSTAFQCDPRAARIDHLLVVVQDKLRETQTKFNGAKAADEDLLLTFFSTDLSRTLAELETAREQALQGSATSTAQNDYFTALSGKYAALGATFTSFTGKLSGKNYLPSLAAAYDVGIAHGGFGLKEAGALVAIVSSPETGVRPETVAAFRAQFGNFIDAYLGFLGELNRRKLEAIAEPVLRPRLVFDSLPFVTPAGCSSDADPRVKLTIKDLGGSTYHFETWGQAFFDSEIGKSEAIDQPFEFVRVWRVDGALPVNAQSQVYTMGPNIIGHRSEAARCATPDPALTPESFRKEFPLYVGSAVLPEGHPLRPLRDTWESLAKMYDNIDHDALTAHYDEILANVQSDPRFHFKFDPVTKSGACDNSLPPLAPGSSPLPCL